MIAWHFDVFILSTSCQNLISLWKPNVWIGFLLCESFVRKIWKMRHDVESRLKVFVYCRILEIIVNKALWSRNTTIFFNRNDIFSNKSSTADYIREITIIEKWLIEVDYDAITAANRNNVLWTFSVFNFCIICFYDCRLTGFMKAWIS